MLTFNENGNKRERKIALNSNVRIFVAQTFNIIIAFRWQWQYEIDNIEKRNI